VPHPGAAGLPHLRGEEEIGLRRPEPARTGRLQVLHSHQDGHGPLAFGREGRRGVFDPHHGLTRPWRAAGRPPRAGGLCANAGHALSGAPAACAAMPGSAPWSIQDDGSFALRDGGDVRLALSGDGDPGDQHGSRERPIPGAVALRRCEKRSGRSLLNDKSFAPRRFKATTLGRSRDPPQAAAPLSAATPPPTPEPAFSAVRGRAARR
jgi:hypothetical protein